MGGELVAWIFYSPRRLALVADVTLLALLGLGGLLGRLTGTGAADAVPAGAAARSTDGSSQPASGATRPTPPAIATGGSSPGAAQVPDAVPFVSTAVEFVQAWGALRTGETAAQWHDRVDPLVTADLAAALQLTDPAKLPGARPSGRPTVRFVANTSALIAVPLSDGSTVLVTVISAGLDWQVADIQPDVGDAGDVGGAAQATASATPGPAPRTRTPNTKNPNTKNPSTKTASTP